ncbi:MFS transporter [Bacillus sp. 03113]|uniref:MFS transporter n=1 Tax=Bacillus sp. 03113 TaxID=2578211 RepID=UPI0015E888A0|nr:MFS transporter [Bacillus sp. 03113]
MPILKQSESITLRYEALALVRNKKFLLLWFSSLFTGFSLSMYLLAESWYVVDYLHLKSALGFVLMATALPRVLLMIFGGVIADRLKPTAIMFFSNFIRSILLGIMIIFLILNQLNIWILTFFALCFGVLDAFFWPANQSIVPSIANKNQLTLANSFLQFTNRTTSITGPLIAGWLIAVSSFKWVFVAIALLLITGGMLMNLLKLPINSNSNSTILKDLKDGFDYVFTSPFLIGAMIISILTNFVLAGPATLAAPIMTNEILDGNALDLSYLEGSISGGMLIGTILVAFWNPRNKRGFISIIRLIFLGLSLVSLSQSITMWQAILCFTIVGMTITIGDIPLQTLIQERTHPDKLGRVSGLLGTASMGLVPISYALTSTLLSLNITISTLLLYSGILLILFSIIAVWKLHSFVTAD